MLLSESIWNFSSFKFFINNLIVFRLYIIVNYYINIQIFKKYINHEVIILYQTFLIFLYLNIYYYIDTVRESSSYNPKWWFNHLWEVKQNKEIEILELNLHSQIVRTIIINQINESIQVLNIIINYYLYKDN